MKRAEKIGKLILISWGNKSKARQAVKAVLSVSRDLQDVEICLVLKMYTLSNVILRQNVTFEKDKLYISGMLWMFKF